jgi:hypothetical protein
MDSLTRTLITTLTISALAAPSSPSHQSAHTTRTTAAKSRVSSAGSKPMSKHSAVDLTRGCVAMFFSRSAPSDSEGVVGESASKEIFEHEFGRIGSARLRSCTCTDTQIPEWRMLRGCCRSGCCCLDHVLSEEMAPSATIVPPQYNLMWRK